MSDDYDFVSVPMPVIIFVPIVVMIMAITIVSCCNYQRSSVQDAPSDNRLSMVPATSMDLTATKTDPSVLIGVPMTDNDITRAKRSARRHKGQGCHQVLPQTASKSARADEESAQNTDSMMSECSGYAVGVVIDSHQL